MSPSCTNVVSPPTHRGFPASSSSSRTPAIRSARLACPMSPCRSPIATTRPGAVTRSCGYVSSPFAFARVAHSRVAPRVARPGTAVARVPRAPSLVPRAPSPRVRVARAIVVAARASSGPRVIARAALAPRGAVAGRARASRACLAPPTRAWRATARPRLDAARIARDDATSSAMSCATLVARVGGRRSTRAPVCGAATREGERAA